MRDMKGIVSPIISELPFAPTHYLFIHLCFVLRAICFKDWVGQWFFFVKDEQIWTDVCFVSKSCQLYSFMELKLFPKKTKKKKQIQASVKKIFIKKLLGKNILFFYKFLNFFLFKEPLYFNIRLGHW
jgi:hypothetical protein